MSCSEGTGRLPIKAPRMLRNTLLEFTLMCLLDQPKQVSPYAKDYFEKVCLKHTPMTYEPMECLSSSDECEEEEEEESIVGESDFPFDYPVDYEIKRGNVVYSEPYNPEKDDEDDDEAADTVYPKTEEELQLLNDVVPGRLLFKALDKEQLKRIIGVMFSREVEPGELVIKQFDDGDYFYVIDHGIYDVLIASQPGAEPEKVFSYDNNGTFGELALMYNMPRAATVQAVTKGKLWAMDRSTFRKIVLKAAFKKRKMYEELIQNVRILQELTNYERMRVADALVPRYFADGTTIIQEGDTADGMYFIEKGVVEVYIYDAIDGKDVLVTTMEKGDYFGELALINHKPRAATVIASGDVTLAFLDVDAFERVLGPCVNIMKRNFERYKKEFNAAKSFASITKKQSSSIKKVNSEGKSSRGLVGAKKPTSTTSKKLVSFPEGGE